MMKQKNKAKFLLLFFLLFPISSAQPSSDRLKSLRRGTILSDGGYLEKGIWSTMEGVIQAPPDIVWQIFFMADEWKKHQIPTLLDSRIVHEEKVATLTTVRDIQRAYKVMGEEHPNALERRQAMGEWVDYIFQYYDVPWPIPNKWFVTKTFYNEKKRDSGFYQAHWISVAGNIHSLNGSMTLEPFEGDIRRTLVTYRVETDPGSSVPGFLMKWGVKQTLPGVIHAVRQAAARIVGQPPPILRAPPE